MCIAMIARRSLVLLPVTAALAMAGDPMAAAEARTTLLHQFPGYSLARLFEQSPITGEILDSLSEGLSRAGVPEE